MPKALQLRSEHSEASSASADRQSFSRVSISSLPAIRLQPKLTVNTPGDAYEQEADRVADHVMRMRDPGPAAGPTVSLGGAGLQRECACGGTCAECRAGRVSEELMRMHSHGAAAGPAVSLGSAGAMEAPPLVHEVLRSPGQPLDKATREFMEPRFGHDFSGVRVHTDAKAAESARAVGARAYTVETNVVFGAGEYSLSSSGHQLIAHELTHCLQQDAVGFFPSGGVNTGIALQRQAHAPRIELPSSEEPTIHATYSAHEWDNLGDLLELVRVKTNAYAAYRDAISKLTATEKRAALGRPEFLSMLKDRLDALSFARCMELLGRRAPNFDELRKNSVVQEALSSAWSQSDVGGEGIVAQPHEEGGWVFMDLIDGSLSIQRVVQKSVTGIRGVRTTIGRDFIVLEPPPDVPSHVVLVAMFHTHPTLGPGARPSGHDRGEDARRGVPNLVAGETGRDPKKFEVYLSGPPARKHLASDRKIPGGGIAP